MTTTKSTPGHGPRRRRVIPRLEEWGKRLTVAPFGALLRPPPLESPIVAGRIRSILFLRNDGIGDMVLSTPMWRILKQRHPEIRIGIVTSSRNSAIVESDPDVDFRYDCRGNELPSLLRAARETRRISWDLVMPLIYFKKTKMALLCKLFAPKATSSMVLMRANRSERYAHLFSVVLTTSYDPSRDLMLDLMREHFERTLGLLVADDEWKLSLRPDDRGVASIRSAVADVLSADGTKGYVQVHLEAKDAFHELGVEGSLALSKELTALHPDRSVLWTASSRTADAAKRFLDVTPTPCVHFQPTASLHELVGIVRGAELVLSPDTSVVHVAAAERGPLVGLYEHFPHQWRPSHQPSRVVTPPHGQPVSAISIDAVVRECRDLLSA